MCNQKEYSPSKGSKEGLHYVGLIKNLLGELRKARQHHQLQ